MTAKLTPEERHFVDALRAALKLQPATLWLFAGNGGISVMRYGDDGRAVMTNDGGVDQRECVATVKCDADGGAW